MNITKVLFTILLLFIGYRVLKSMGIIPSGGGTKDELDKESSDTELIQDPECKTYFQKDRAIKAVADGKTYYFCSKECRDRYLPSSGERK